MRAHLSRFHVTKLAGASLLAAGFGMAFTTSSCTTPATEIVAGFTTQIRVPQDLRSVAVVVTQGGTPKLCRGYKVVDGTVTLPTTLGSIPDDERDGVPAEPVFIGVFGYRNELPADFDLNCVLTPPSPTDVGENNPGLMVVRKAGVIYTEDQILYAHMPLRESCADVMCADDETCVGGVCEAAEVSGELPLYRDELIFGRGLTCFDPTFCTPTGSGIPAVMVDKSDCTFELAIPEEDRADLMPGLLNVEVVYRSMGTEIMDLDDREGFIFDNPDEPWRFRLAANLCTSQFDTLAPKIVSVKAWPFCPPKDPLTPICDGSLQDIQAGTRSPASAIAEGTDLCPLGEPLQATESLLYVLMDRSASMSDFFEPGALDFAVGLSLENPIAARTRFAFSFVPAPACSTSPNPFLDPLHGFGEPNEVQDAVAAELGNSGNVLGADGDINWGLAMEGAYTALHAINDNQSATFNRKAVVLVGNRDFVEHCGTDLSSLASTELADADQIHTYVALLRLPDGTSTSQTDASAIATAGGTDVFDDVASEGEGALAVQKVLNDLGSCLYDPITPPNGFELDEITHLTFVHPITGDATIVPFDTSCTAPDANVDGFGYDVDGQVVICGQPCTTLRDALSDTAGVYALQGQAAPAIPIVPSLSCSVKAERFQGPGPATP